MTHKHSGLPTVHAIAAVIIVFSGIPFVTKAAMEVQEVAVISAVKRAEPRSMNHELFDAKQFQQLRRQRRSDASSAPVTQQTSSSSSAPVDPCDKTSHAAADSSVARKELHFDDLATSQQETLRLQLRGDVCPGRDETYGKAVDEDAEAYRALCEKMRAKQRAEGKRRNGPRNSVSGYLQTK